MAKKLQSVCGVENFSRAAEIFGVTPNGARNYLVGEREPTSRVLANLHAATGVDLNWLLDDSDERDGPVYVRKKR